MALDGGGGGGGLLGVSNSFVGPQEALELVGDHAYAYAGKIAVTAGSSASTTMLKFQTGNYYFVGTVAWNNDGGGGSNIYLELLMNGAIMFLANYNQAHESNADQPVPIIIPAYTEFEGKMGSNGNQNVTMVMSGRIYRA